MNLFPFCCLRFSECIAELKHVFRLDVYGLSAARCVVDDAANLGLMLHADRDDIAPVASGEERIGKIVARFPGDVALDLLRDLRSGARTAAE